MAQLQAKTIRVSVKNYTETQRFLALPVKLRKIFAEILDSWNSTGFFVCCSDWSHYILYFTLTYVLLFLEPEQMLSLIKHF